MAILVRLLFVLLIAACEREPLLLEIDDESVSVFSILVADSDTAKVFVSRAREDGGINEVGPVPVENASVRLVHNGSTTTLAYGKRCARSDVGYYLDSGPLVECYTAVIPGGIRAGGTYELLVDVDGQLVRGQVEVPSPPVIRTPSSEIQLGLSVQGNEEPAQAHWTAVQGRIVELRLVADDDSCLAFIGKEPGNFAVSGPVTVTETDSTTFYARGVLCGNNVPQITHARLMVSMYDPEYARYWKRMQDETVEDPGIGLTGAYGYFGAVANAFVPIVLIKR